MNKKVVSSINFCVSCAHHPRILFLCKTEKDIMGEGCFSLAVYRKQNYVVQFDVLSALFHFNSCIFYEELKTSTRYCNPIEIIITFFLFMQ